MPNPELPELTLSQIQRLFKSFLVAEKLSIKGARRHLDSTKAVPLRTRLGIYHYAYFSRILETLEEDFPKLVKHMGKRRFTQLVRKYLEAHPSKEPNIMELGEGFPKFLKEQRLILEQELATFEWLVKLSQFATDAENSNLGELSSLNPKYLTQISFVLSPSVFLYSSNFPVNLKKVRERKKTYLLIYRKRRELKIESLDKNTFELLQAILDGNSLAQIERKFKKSKMNLEIQNKYFSEWVQFGIISHWKKSAALVMSKT